MTIRVLVVDDQELIRAGFAALVGAAPDMEVVGEADDGAAAIEIARRERPDVVLIDIRMPGMDGIAATEVIAADPDLADVKVIVLTTFEMDEYVVAALRAGASGFLGKGVRPAALLDGIRTVAGGDSLLSPKATRSLIAQVLDQHAAPVVDGEAFAHLTPREREIVELVARGLSNDEIAAQLYLSPLTAKTHVNRSMMKLGARDRAQLVVFAYQSGLAKG
ncbi:response regulator transcription factor [Cellulomonas sp. PhB150]|uniref:response regulator n=1 Tax=Cellulomonas sp. PhB150 TaxID=2485188 RepID=UPI000F47F4C1|nr:response regulator transcription factor [Cellulomonas sp. PhB150]ROS31096.1 LuxR family two component transcriptional regulator [Cellulomonas sp. PhB150]